MKAFITGITGQDGYYLSKLLLEKGYEVHGIKRRTSLFNTNRIDHLYQDPHVKDRNFILHHGDMTESSTMIRIMNDISPDEVYNLAAQSHVDVSFNSPLETTKANVLGTHSILNACLENKSRKLIVMSTDEVYGSVSEISDHNLLDPTNPYSASKAAADMIVNSYKHMYKDMSIITLRSNNIIGPGQFIRNIIPRFSCLGILGKKMTIHGTGESRRRYLWIEDVIDAFLLIAEKANKNKIYNIGHNKSYSNIQIAEMIGSYLNLSDF